MRNKYMGHDACVCCGAYVPEGRQVCATCEKINEIEGGWKMNEAQKICVLCSHWQPAENKIITIRQGGTCALTGTITRLTEKCWGWKTCSPQEVAKRKKAGYIEEAGKRVCQNCGYPSVNKNQQCWACGQLRRDR